MGEYEECEKLDDELYIDEEDLLDEESEEELLEIESTGEYLFERAESRAAYTEGEDDY